MKAVQVKVRSWRNAGEWRSSCVVWAGELADGKLTGGKAELVTANRRDAERHAANLAKWNRWEMLETEEKTF